jgi:hypothetical protein
MQVVQPDLALKRTRAVLHEIHHPVPGVLPVLLRIVLHAGDRCGPNPFTAFSFWHFRHQREHVPLAVLEIAEPQRTVSQVSDLMGGAAKPDPALKVGLVVMMLL